MKTSKIIASLVLCTGICLNWHVSAEDAAQLPSSLDFKTVKVNKDNRLFQVTLMAEDTNGRLPAPGALVEFFLQAGDSMEKIGEAKTDINGRGELDLTGASSLRKNSDGYLHFKASFSGNESLEPSESEVQVKDAWLELEFFMEDSIRKVRYSGFTYAGDGNRVPITDQDIYLYVPRMFSLMPIVEGWLEGDGSGVAEFPQALVGDEHGVINVISKIEDHPDFGNLEANATIDWALLKHTEQPEGPIRELWTPVAPTWMIITLLTMLVGVWIHYFYAIYELFRIKRAGQHHKQF